jgi:hypothetical protein
MPSLNELRAEARRRQQAANAKVRRLRAKGVEVEGTNYDPRRDISRINRYTRQQLTNYIGELNAFTSRGNQYTRLANGFVPSREWRAYKAPERQYNRIGKRQYDRVSDLQLPNTGMTVSERDATMRPTNPKIRRGSGEAVRRIYEPVNLRPEQVDSPEALRKLIAFRKRQISRKYEPEQIARQRREMRGMVARIGDDEIRKATESLTEDQFKVLWNYGSFATDLSRDYERIQLLATGGAAAEQDRVHEDARADIIDAVNWAKTNVPEKRQRATKRR